MFDALVIGMPDDLLGQRVAALVQPRPGAEPDPAALQEHVRGHIAGYKVPRTIWLTGTISAHGIRQGRLHLGPRVRCAHEPGPWTRAGDGP